LERNVVIAVSSGLLFAAVILSPWCLPCEAVPPRVDSAKTSPWPTAGWTVASPQSLGLDPGRLEALAKRLGQGEFGSFHSLLIVRNGRLAFERYFRGWGPSDLHTVQSVTKSVSSLLVGIAIDQKKIGSVDKRLLDLVPEYQNSANLDDRKRAIELVHVLTMSSGIEWDESSTYGSSGNNLSQMHRSGDWVRFVLDRPMIHPPGRRFRYNSGGTMVLAAVLKKATGLNADEFAQRHLFEPLGIRDVDWRYRSPNGLPETGGGLFLTPREMAKIGYLVLCGGRWEGRQVVSERWVRQSMQRYFRNVHPLSRYKVDYGYLWWLFSEEQQAPPLSQDMIFAWGADGQFIFIDPSDELVVVMTAGNYGHDRLGMQALLEGVLPAIRRKSDSAEIRAGPS
jgi:CubicO group peptidase (beta-lactamase class C family)